MPRRMPVEHPVSAGGVVYRLTSTGIEVLLCGQLTPPTWGLPKGTPNPEETLIETARREVEEETGLKVEVLPKIGSIRYWFVKDGIRYHKSVHFFLMRPVGGSIEQHDVEFDVVRWFPLKEALRTLTYQNDVQMVQQAAKMILADTEHGLEREQSQITP